MKEEIKVIPIVGLDQLISEICLFIIEDDEGEKKTKRINVWKNI